ncbi:MAG: hypothetical protein K6A64_01900 [Bacteroidales bacterium]|nr:hypothetical protein [Bacteroidales bacterium]
MKNYSIILFLIVLFSFSSCEKGLWFTGTPDLPVIRLIPGDCFESSSLRLTDITTEPSEPKLGYGRESYLIGIPAEAYGGFVCDAFNRRELYYDISASEYEDTVFYKLHSPEFWAPEPISQEEIITIRRYYEKEVYANLSSYAYNKRKEAIGLLASALLQCSGGLSITADKSLFGKEPGEDISDYFEVGNFSRFQVQGLSFEPNETKEWIPATDYFSDGKMISYWLKFVATEPFTGPVTLTIDISVNKVMYLTYLRDKMRNGEAAELTLVPHTFHGTVVMNNIK